MNDDTNPQDNAELETSEQQNPEEAKPAKQNFAFYTHSEAGIAPMNPNDIPAAPRPQPGMTFTPTGGSVSNIGHPASDDDSSDETDTSALNQQ